MLPRPQVVAVDVNSPEGQRLMFGDVCPYDGGGLESAVIPLPNGRSTTVRKTCRLCQAMYFYNPGTGRFAYM